MKFLDEFQDPRLVKGLLQEIGSLAKRRVTFMEVCGTHTMALNRFGIRAMLPNRVDIISGPGCPVCVTPTNVIDAAIEAANIENVILTTFGDMMRVPGSSSSLEAEKALRSDIRVVYSAMDSLGIAEGNPDREVVLLRLTIPHTVKCELELVVEDRLTAIIPFEILDVFILGIVDDFHGLLQYPLGLLSVT